MTRVTPEEAAELVAKNAKALLPTGSNLQALNRKQRRMLLSTKVQKEALKKIGKPSPTR